MVNKDKPKQDSSKMPELALVEALREAKLKSHLRFICHDNLVIEVQPGEEEKVLDIVSEARRGKL